MKKLEKLMKAFANRRRLEIIEFIRDSKSASVGDIAARIRLSFKATSKHLGILFASDLVDREQTGLQMFYKIAPGKEKMIDTILSILK